MYRYNVKCSKSIRGDSMNAEVWNVKMICVAGFSTNFLSNRIQEAARAHGQRLVISAISEVYLDDEIADTDLVLIAPQIDYLYDELFTYIDADKTIVKVIPMELYGTMDGEKVLLFIHECMKERN